MFLPGTKIMVLASTKRHGLGPRLGSVGFVQGCLDQQPVNNFIGTFGASTTLNEVIFTRFGFETKERVEKKRIIFVFPILVDTEKTPAIGQIKHFIKVMSSKKKNPVHNLLLHERFDVPQNTPVVLASPFCFNRNLVKTSNSEFVAWFESHIKTDQLFAWLTETLISKHYLNSGIPQINRDNLEIFINVITDNNFKTSYIENATGSEENKLRLVNIVQPIFATANTRILHEVYENIYRSLLEADYKKQTNFSVNKLISKYVFYPGIDNVLARSARLKKIDKFLKIVEDIGATKDAISGLSSRFCWR